MLSLYDIFVFITSLLAFTVNLALLGFLKYHKNELKNSELEIVPLIKLLLVSVFFDLAIFALEFRQINPLGIRSFHEIFYPIFSLHILFDCYKTELKMKKIYLDIMLLLFLIFVLLFFWKVKLYETMGFGIAGLICFVFSMRDFFKFKEEDSFTKYFVLWLSLMLFFQYLFGFVIDIPMVKRHRNVFFTIGILNFIFQTIFRFVPIYYFYVIRKLNN